RRNTDHGGGTGHRECYLRRDRLSPQSPPHGPEWSHTRKSLDPTRLEERETTWSRLFHCEMIRGLCPNLGIASFSSRDRRQVTSYSLMTCNQFPVTGLAFGLPQVLGGFCAF